MSSLLMGGVGTAGSIAKPVNTVSPAISGLTTQNQPVQGQILTTTNGTWTNSPTSYSYQWQSNLINVGTNANTYTPVSGDVGNLIDCVVTATNGGGSTNAQSNTTSAVKAAYLDTFFDTNGTSLTTHTMDVGNGWSSATGWTIQSNRANSDGTHNALTNLTTAITASTSLSDFYPNSSSDIGMQLLARNDGSGNAWEGRWRYDGGANNYLEVTEIVSGTPTQRATHVMGGTLPGASYRIILSFNSANTTVTVTAQPAGGGSSLGSVSYTPGGALSSASNTGYGYALWNSGDRTDNFTVSSP